MLPGQATGCMPRCNELRPHLFRAGSARGRACAKLPMPACATDALAAGAGQPGQHLAQHHKPKDPCTSERSLAGLSKRLPRMRCSSQHAAPRPFLLRSAPPPRAVTTRSAWWRGQDRSAASVQAAGAERLCAGAGGARRQRPCGAVAAAASRSHDPESPVVVLAGFYVEELANVRHLLDSVGGERVRVLPTSPELLGAPAYVALQSAEPAWDRPVPADWQHGGGWGQQRMALIAGIE